MAEVTIDFWARRSLSDRAFYRNLVHSCLLISSMRSAHGYFAYVNNISFAYPEQCQGHQVERHDFGQYFIISQLIYGQGSHRSRQKVTLIIIKFYIDWFNVFRVYSVYSVCVCIVSGFVTPCIKRDFAGGPKFKKMTMPDSMSSY